MGDIDFRGD